MNKIKKTFKKKHSKKKKLQKKNVKIIELI